jgi:hypothetical protein
MAYMTSSTAAWFLRSGREFSSQPDDDGNDVTIAVMLSVQTSAVLAALLISVLISVTVRRN